MSNCCPNFPCAPTQALTAEAAAQLPLMLERMGRALNPAVRTIDQALRCLSGVPFVHGHKIEGKMHRTSLCPPYVKYDHSTWPALRAQAGIPEFRMAVAGHDAAFQSPWKDGHFGLLLQDLSLTLRGATLTANNSRDALKAVGLRRGGGPPRILFTARQTGDVGNLMFLYATVMGFAARFGGEVVHKLPTEDSQDATAASFFREFGLRAREARAPPSFSMNKSDGSFRERVATEMHWRQMETRSRGGEGDERSLVNVSSIPLPCAHVVREELRSKPQEGDADGAGAYCQANRFIASYSALGQRQSPWARKCTQVLIKLNAGYWQSFKYFHHARPSVAAVFNFSASTRTFARRNLNRLRVRSHAARLVGVEVRLGVSKVLGGNRRMVPAYQPTGIGFYAAAMAQVRQHYALMGIRSVAFVVNTDSPEVVRAHLETQDDSDVTINEHADGVYADMALLAACDGLIIGPSALGWWAAYLSTTAEFVVSAAETFSSAHPLRRVFRPQDYFPPGWTLLPNNASVASAIATEVHVLRRPSRPASHPLSPQGPPLHVSEPSSPSAPTPASANPVVGSMITRTREGGFLMPLALIVLVAVHRRHAARCE